MQKKSLGILLSTAPPHPNTSIALGLIQAAGQKQVPVSLYLVDDGVSHINDPTLSALRGPHVRLFVCAYGCQQRSLPTTSKDVSITYCGLVVLSNIVHASQRFIALN